MGADAGNTSGIKDVGGIGGTDNNADSKIAYTKADFSTYNIIGVNAGAGVGDMIFTGEKVGNNTNNIGVDQSGKLGGADESRVGRADNRSTGWVNIKAGKKADTGVIASTNNSADGGDKVTDQRAGLAGLVFTPLAAANCAANSNLAISEGTPSSAATFTPDEFLAIFAALANTTLKRKPKVCESNPFLFATHHQ